jgi:hypothetical protein
MTKVAYENPHPYVWVDVKDGSGKMVSNTFQLSSPSNLKRWRRDYGVPQRQRR